MDEYMGAVRAFAFNYAPPQFALCNGALLAISSNPALFALLGTIYGGNGQSTFALPNLQGCTVIGQGRSFTGTVYTLGQIGGTETNTLTSAQMPMHSHIATSILYAEGDDGSLPGPADHMFGALDNLYAPASGSDNQALNTQSIVTTVQPSGGSQPVNNMSPFVALTYCICTSGLFPTRP